MARSTKQKRIAIFVGSFNPFTIGHADIVSRAIQLFDELVIGVGCNPDKEKTTDTKQRAKEIKKLYSSEPRIKVEAYEGLTVEFAKKHGASVIVRGMRNTADFEYERNQAECNRLIDDSIETVTLFTKPELAPISSTLIRTLQEFNVDVSDYIPNLSIK